MSREKQIKEMANDLRQAEVWDDLDGVLNRTKTAQKLYKIGYRKQSEWISVDERLPSENEYLTYHKDGLSTLKRLVIAYKTDTIEYAIGCYDGYKWVNQLGNRIIKNVVAWKSFELYLPKAEGGAE